MTPDTTPDEPRADAVPKRPLTVVMACDTFAPDVNGASRFSERLAAGLTRRGHEVHIMTPSVGYRNSGTFVEEIDGVPLTVHRFPGVRWKPHDWLRFVWPWRAKHYARQVLDAVPADVVHSQSHIVIGRGLTRVARKRGIPVVATNHVMAENIIDFTTLPPLLDKLFVTLAWADAKRTFDMSRAVTTPTRKAAEFLEATIDIHDVIPVSCGIDAGNYRPDLTPREKMRVLFVGRLTTEKHVDVVLRAIAKLAPELDVTFDVVGGGDQLHSLQQLTAQLGIEDRVTFHGRTSEEDLRDFLSRASVFAIASIAELQSIATMEAMASGLPVVAADAMALPHLVHHGENGYLFEPGDVQALAARLTEVLTAGERKLTALKRNSLAFIQPHDIDRTLSTFESLYRGLPVDDPVTDIEPVATAED